MVGIPLMLTLGAAVTAASFLSGVFGMAGGMLLMGLLVMILPVPVAMVLHAASMMTANAWRAFVWRREVDYRVFLRFCVGMLAACGLLFSFRYVPDRLVILFCLGIVPFLAALIPPRLVPQADRRGGAELCGLLNTLMQFMAGVSGPLLDAFFVRTPMDRRTVVATKAICQTTAHTAKLIYFLNITSEAHEALSLPIYAIAISTAIIGTSLSKLMLERLSNAQFYRWTRWLIMFIGVIYLTQAFYVYFTR